MCVIFVIVYSIISLEAHLRNEVKTPYHKLAHRKILQGVSGQFLDQNPRYKVSKNVSFSNIKPIKVRLSSVNQALVNVLKVIYRTFGTFCFTCTSYEDANCWKLSQVCFFSNNKLTQTLPFHVSGTK